MAHTEKLQTNTRYCACGDKLPAGSYRHCDACAEKSAARSRSAYQRRAMEEGRRMVSARSKSHTSRRRKHQPTAQERLLAEQREAEQRRIDKEIDERMTMKLESKVYKPGSPEFESLAKMYMTRG